MSYLCLLCLFAYSGVQHILCCAFIVFLRVENPMLLVSLDQGSHYFQIGGRSDFSFRELTGRRGRQQKEVVRLLGEVNCD